jgi:hypothetical protein
MIVQPATVLRWRRQGLRSIWTYGSRGRWRGGRPRVAREIRDLIVRMSRENFLWGAPRIHGELLKLGFDVSQATVSRYMPRRDRLPSQSWRTFLRNQAAGDDIISFGEAGGPPDQFRSLVSGWIERIVWYATKMWDGLFAPLGPLQPGSSRAARHCWRLHSNLSTVGTFTRRPLDDDRSATFAISLKSIATTRAATYPTVGAIIQPSTALASARPIGPRLLLHTRRQACHARR